MKNIPQRTCIVCRTQKNKNELLRIVKNKASRIVIKPTNQSYINIMYQQLTLTSDATINQNDSQGPKKNADNVPTF